MPTRDDSETHFINVDLDIYSKSDLEPLVAALGERVYVLYVGRLRRTYEAHLELAFSAARSHNADAYIRRFATLIAALPKAQRELWDTAKSREFSIAVHAQMQPFSWETVLSAETVAAAARLKARIGFTVYVPEAPRTVAKKKRASARRQKAL
jgi:glycosyltransferase involved in cell wall biosynthesis